jgi:hypothetical protein
MAFNVTDFSNKWADFKEEIKSYFNRAIDKNGDTMNGSLILAKDPDKDMEAVNRRWLYTFIPGDLRTIHFGKAQTEFPYDYIVFDSRNASSYIGVKHTCEATTTHYPLASGKIKARFEIPMIVPELKAWSGSGWTGTGGFSKYIHQITSAILDIRISCVIDENTTVLIWEEKDVDLCDAISSSGSIFGSKQTVEINEFPVVMNKYPTISMEVTMKSWSNTTSSKADNFSMGFPSIKISLSGDISNPPILDTTNIY